MLDLPDINLVILDDAFQHRYAQSDISFLLTEYSRPFFKDFVLPFGLLREYRSGYKRADCVIVTKTPSISQAERDNFISKLRLHSHQTAFFSSITYNQPHLISNHQTKINNPGDHSAILLSGIANNRPIVSYLKAQTSLLDVITFKDHHKFSLQDIKAIKDRIQTKQQPNTILITTEKDAARIDDFFISQVAIDIYVLPIRITVEQGFISILQSLKKRS